MTLIDQRQFPTCACSVSLPGIHCFLPSPLLCTLPGCPRQYLLQKTLPETPKARLDSSATQHRSSLCLLHSQHSLPVCLPIPPTSLWEVLKSPISILGIQYRVLAHIKALKQILAVKWKLWKFFIWKVEEVKYIPNNFHFQKIHCNIFKEGKNKAGKPLKDWSWCLALSPNIS